MRPMKIAVGVLLIVSSIATVISYYWYRISLLDTHIHSEINKATTEHKYARGTPMKHIPLDVVYKDIRGNDQREDSLELEEIFEAKMVDTAGCKIPVMLVDYARYIKNNTKRIPTCGKRGVFLRKYDDNTVQAFIKERVIQQYKKHRGTQYYCCYQFLINKIAYGRDRKAIFSNCLKFKDNSKIRLQRDFINIKCFEYTMQNKTYPIYDDMYAFVNKINTPGLKDIKNKTIYNVLMIGMDSMSLPRAVQTLPRTVDYFKNDFWISYRGYHKVADNTFPNLMAAFTGKNMTTIAKKCSGRMDNCNSLMIWQDFKEAGYITAYGEDNLQLPDTFTNEYEFKKAPTDHYMRPFFLKGEYRYKDSTFLCTGKACSGQQILNYAFDFAHTYRKQAFFGVFWINSFSHDADSEPQAADKMIENFFFQLTYTGVLTNTFVIFFSDHGIRFGSPRFKVEAYYDDRMPMFFMWSPLYFKGSHPYALRAIAINQYRLITPYDIYSTLIDIKQISTGSNVTFEPPDGCPNCHTTFEVISGNRTCQDASIDDKWCSCHKLYPLPVQDPEALKSVDVVVKNITSMIKTIKTKRCWGCMSLTLKTVIRIHFYYDKDKISLYYVVAFTMAPGNASYEATILRKSNESQGTIIGLISFITPYRGLGKCTVNRRDRLFCVCQKKEVC